MAKCSMGRGNYCHCNRGAASGILRARWEQRMEIARRKNRPQWEYPGYAHEKE